MEKKLQKQFIDSTRFLTSSLLNLVNNLAERIQKTKCKYRHDNKNYETCGMFMLQ